ncbi:hypothetical protein SAMN04487819_10387 [Actinopolyspora alba]|uniref:Uncharacterized protein n=1 Tax=Actinopolyspora alba TaxID=673379 RepID=A0A1I1V3U8_9ACTN|nr:hypothetical protein [Actinopolyspora alba]SFD77712.1 hypothetical protein SAMN04487819_10387 [Actinopolyspora alba]
MFTATGFRPRGDTPSSGRPGAAEDGHASRSWSRDTRSRQDRSDVAVDGFAAHISPTRVGVVLR